MNSAISDLTRIFSTLFLGTLVWIHWPQTPAPTPIPQWEYTIESIPDLGFGTAMNNLGKQGWEMVFARRASSGASYNAEFSYEVIFKRPMVTPPP